MTAQATLFPPWSLFAICISQPQIGIITTAYLLLRCHNFTGYSPLVLDINLDRVKYSPLVLDIIQDRVKYLPLVLDIE